MIDIKKLRGLAQVATPGGWYVEAGSIIRGSEVVTGEEWNPIIASIDDDEGLAYEANAEFIAAANPAVVLELLELLESVEAEVLEQARLNGMGAEREFALMRKLEAVEKERSADSEEPTIDWQSTCETWKAAHDKVKRITNELQDTVQQQAHEIERLRTKIAEMEWQEPECEVVGQVRNVLYEVRTLKYDLPAGTKFYALPGAQPAAVMALMAKFEAAERDGQRKQKRIEQLEYALRAMTKTYKSVAYAQWPAEMHLVYEVLEESK